ncbi:MAG: ribonuclease R [Parvibaculales bacterium]
MTERISRQDILDFISNADGKVGKREIARAFNIKGSEKIILKRWLKEMLADGQIEGNTREGLRPGGVLPSVSMVQVTHRDEDGELHGHPIVRGETLDAYDVIITSRQRPPAPGDRVLARLKKTEGTTYQASVMRKIATPTGLRFIGVVTKAQSGLRVDPTDRRERNDYPVQGETDAEQGDLVWAEKLSGDEPAWRKRDQKVKILEVICRADDPGAFSLIALAEQGIPLDFDAEVLQQAAEVGPISQSIYEDLRALPFITIDPADARDHDDAVLAVPDPDSDNQGGFQVYVAIADVAAYVQPETAMDREARKRGNSVYLPDRVVPMLPERLSTDLCSLRPDEDRPALVVRMRVNKYGEITKHSFTRALITSKARLSYQQAQLAFDGAPDEDCAPLQDVVLTPLWQAYLLMAQARDKRSPLNLDLPERKVVMNEQKQIVDIFVPQRLEAMRLIEELMVSANVCAAKTLEKHKQGLIYRIHDAPALEKVHALADFLKPLGVKLDLGQPLIPRLFNRVLMGARKQAGEEDADLGFMTQEAVLRTQSQAIYSPNNIGHFGLALSQYAHFTSPIRRYADLTVHRALIAALNMGEDGLCVDEEELAPIAEHISSTERRAMLAERSAKDRYLSAFLAERVEELFDGTISGISSAGLFVKLSHTGADGLLPASRLGSERFYKDEDGLTLTGGTTGLTFKVGQSLRVRLVKAEPIKGGLLFSLAEGGSYEKDSRPAPARRGRPLGKMGKRHKAAKAAKGRANSGKPGSKPPKKSKSRAGRRRAKTKLKK